MSVPNTACQLRGRAFSLTSGFNVLDAIVDAWSELGPGHVGNRHDHGGH